MSKQIMKEIASAYRWNTISQVANQALLFFFNVLFIRFLSPADFGYVAVPLIIYSLFRIIQDLGFADVILKDVTNDKELYTSIFWLLVFLGITFSGIFFIGCYLLKISDLLIYGLLSISIFLGSFAIGFETLFKKKLFFKYIFYVDLVSNIVSSLTCIGMIYQGWKWEALLTRIVLQLVLSICLYVFLNDDRIALRLNRNKISRHSSFAFVNIFDQVLSYISKNIDTFLIGLLYSEKSLGIYDRAYKIINLPVQQTSTAISRVMLPDMAQHMDDREIRKTILQKNLLIALSLIIPISAILFSIGHEFVLLIFGTKWLDLVPLVKLFALAAPWQVILAILPGFIIIQNSNRDYIKFSLTTRLTIIIGMILACIFSHSLSSIAAMYMILHIIVVAGYYLVLDNEIKDDLLSDVIKYEVIKIILLGLCIYFVNTVLMNCVNDLKYKMGLCIFVNLVMLMLGSRVFRIKAYQHINEIIKS